MFAVIFEVHPRQGHWDDYLNHAGILRPEVQAIDGFISNERFASRTEPGWLVSLSIWRDEKAVVRWRTHAQHHEFQAKGRSEILQGYHLRVAEVTADSDSRTPLPQQRFDATEVGESKFLTLIEAPMQPDTPFESITTPGRGLTLQGWPDQQSAEASLINLTGRRRIVRVIRDYGMRDRAEAPTYYPPVP
jgi:heme-degrading monooxygenase HmoA